MHLPKHTPQQHDVRSCVNALNSIAHTLSSLDDDSCEVLIPVVDLLKQSLALRRVAMRSTELLKGLPLELLQMVAQHVRPDDALAFALVCKRTRTAVFTRFTDRAYPTRLLIRLQHDPNWSHRVNRCRNLKRLQCDPKSNLFSMSRLQWAVAAGMPTEGFQAEMLFSQAAALGNLEMLLWLHGIGYAMNHWACENAAKAGNLEVLLWLRSIGCPGTHDSSTCYSAAGSGHLLVLQWAIQNGCPWDVHGWETRMAAQYGHVHVLDWAGANGCVWGSWTCPGAAKSGHLAALQLARSYGCPWDGTPYQAAKAGHLEIVIWAHAHGAHIITNVNTGAEVDCSDGYVSGACQGGHIAILEWALAQGLDVTHVGSTEAAARGCHLRTLQWLVAHGGELEESVAASAASADPRECEDADILLVLEWLITNGCPWDEETCMAAAGNANLKVLIVLHWARARGCPWNEQDMRTYLTARCTADAPEFRRWLARELGELEPDAPPHV